MSKIKGKDTKPEIAVRRYMHAHGFRFRVGQKIGATKPDIVLRKWKTCLFVHGCYWHRHADCKRASIPSTNTEFWERKLSENVIRDQRNYRQLIEAGWNVGIVWQCRIKDLAIDGLAKRMGQTGLWEF